MSGAETEQGHKAVPMRWRWLLEEPAPKMLIEALSLYGVVEAAGPANNPDILGWAQEIWGARGDYTSDSIPWCGLFMAIVAKRAGKPVPPLFLRARSWLEFGTATDCPELGDVLVFWRKSPESQSGHVGLYVGETPHFYYVLGGNQSDRVCITRIRKDRLLGAFHHYVIGKPRNVRPVYIGAQWGTDVSENEA